MARRVDVIDQKFDRKIERNYDELKSVERKLEGKVDRNYDELKKADQRLEQRLNEFYDKLEEKMNERYDKVETRIDLLDEKLTHELKNQSRWFIGIIVAIVMTAASTIASNIIFN
ncbi:hypothetical protein M1N68_01875 [Peptococcaceae bacterium]|nr:hypothetical protein [Peptococcaceae bacterium]